MMSVICELAFATAQAVGVVGLALIVTLARVLLSDFYARSRRVGAKVPKGLPPPTRPAPPMPACKPARTGYDEHGHLQPTQPWPRN